MRIRSLAHKVEGSPWPIIVSLNIGSILINIWTRGLSNTFILWEGDKISLEGIGIRIVLFLITILWWYYNIEEESISGAHNNLIYKGFYIGFLLFLIGEATIFSALFFSYFYNSLSPDPSIGGVWPPYGISRITIELPLANTLLLLTSSLTLTISHNLLSSSLYPSIILYTLFTIGLGIIFMIGQYIEYRDGEFTIVDSYWGGIFYTITGWHGIHVIIGILLIIFSLLHLFSSFRHTLFLFSTIYWHFVDLIWLFLLLFIYLPTSLSI